MAVLRNLRRGWMRVAAACLLAAFLLPGATVKKTAKGRTGKVSRSAGKRKARSAPAPSYQVHPDPERYKQIQQALAERGYYKGSVNGEWNGDSSEALRRFQADQKLNDDGKISALSLTALGLGPRHDGSTAAAAPAPRPSDVTAEPPATVEPPVVEPPK